MIHAFFAIAFTAITYLFGGPTVAAFTACIMAGYFIGREIACAEYRWINTYGDGKRANMPFFGSFDPRVWDRKSLLDWSVPLIVFIAYIFVRYL